MIYARRTLESCCLIEVNRCVCLPDKIQEGIGRADLLYFLRLGELVPHSSPRSNSEHHDNADDHSDDGGGGVVDHCSHSHFPRSTAI